MKFIKQRRYEIPMNRTPVNAAYMINDIVTDTSEIGELESIKGELCNLTTLLSEMFIVLPEESQILIAEKFDYFAVLGNENDSKF